MISGIHKLQGIVNKYLFDVMTKFVFREEGNLVFGFVSLYNTFLFQIKAIKQYFFYTIDVISKMKRV